MESAPRVIRSVSSTAKRIATGTTDIASDGLRSAVLSFLPIIYFTVEISSKSRQNYKFF
jgi:hypothetical protein